MANIEPQKALISRETASGWCMALALLYLAGPLMIIAELLKPVFWIPAFLLFLAWLRSFDSFLFPAGTRAGGRRWQIAWPRAGNLALGAAVFIGGALWIYCSGIGSFTFCRFDYIKHNFIFASLLQSRLPIVADAGDGHLAIVHYYFAYYIVPVRLYQALHLLIGPLRLEHVTFAIYCLALFGALRLLGSTMRVSALALLAMLAFAGGLDIAGRLLFGAEGAIMGRIPLTGIAISTDLDWWGVPKAPQSLTMNLFWAPQHFFAAIIGVSVIGCILSVPRPAISKLLHVSCVIAAGAFWSPYVAIGLAVVTLGGIRRIIFPTGLAPPDEPGARLLLSPGILGAAVFAILLLAFAAVFFSAAMPASPPEIIFAKASPGDWVFSFLLRQAPALVVLAALTFQRFRSAREWSAVPPRTASPGLLSTVAFLLLADAVLLCFTHGYYNDWAMRTTLPVSILLAAAFCRFLAGQAKLTAKGVLLAALILSSASSLNEIAQSLFLPRQCAPYGTYAWRDLGPLAGQYRGRSDSLLYRWLVRQSDGGPP